MATFDDLPDELLWHVGNFFFSTNNGSSPQNQTNLTALAFTNQRCYTTLRPLLYRRVDLDNKAKNYTHFLRKVHTLTIDPAIARHVHVVAYHNTDSPDRSRHPVHGVIGSKAFVSSIAPIAAAKIRPRDNGKVPASDVSIFQLLAVVISSLPNLTLLDLTGYPGHVLSALERLIDSRENVERKLWSRPLELRMVKYFVTWNEFMAGPVKALVRATECLVVDARRALWSPSTAEKESERPIEYRITLDSARNRLAIDDRLNSYLMPWSKDTFGTVARDFSYNIRVLTRHNLELFAGHLCSRNSDSLESLRLTYDRWTPDAESEFFRSSNSQLVPDWSQFHRLRNLELALPFVFRYTRLESATEPLTELDFIIREIQERDVTETAWFGEEFSVPTRVEIMLGDDVVPADVVPESELEITRSRLVDILPTGLEKLGFTSCGDSWAAVRLNLALLGYLGRKEDCCPDLRELALFGIPTVTVEETTDLDVRIKSVADDFVGAVTYARSMGIEVSTDWEERNV